MKTIKIVGKNYLDQVNNTRIACRAIVLDGDKILLSYETKKDQWMIPGGGLEDGESETECVIRELKEETGYLVKISSLFLKIDEFYEDFHYISYYFIASAIGQTERHLTKQEEIDGLVPRWLSLKEIFDIYSHHQDWKDSDEMRRGMYYREYSALKYFLSKSKIV